MSRGNAAIGVCIAAGVLLLAVFYLTEIGAEPPVTRGHGAHARAAES